MTTAEEVAAFIDRNNATLDKIYEQLDQATNDTLGQHERDRALGTAGHYACRGLRHLRDAEVELWGPLRQLGLTLFRDVPGGRRHQAPRLPLNKELLQLFRHPDPDRAEADIKKADRLLRDVMQGSRGGIEGLLDHAKVNLAELALETCQLLAAKDKRQQSIPLLRQIGGLIVSANVGAAATALQQHGWQAAPGLLRDAADVFQRAGHSIDAPLWVSLVTGAAMIVEAREALHLVRLGIREGRERTERNTTVRASRGVEGRGTNPRDIARAGRRYEGPRSDRESRADRGRSPRGDSR